MSRVKVFAVGVAALLTLGALDPVGASHVDAAAVATSTLASLPAVSAVRACESLGAVDVSAAVGAKATIQSAKAETTAHGSICVIEGNVAPHIGFEMHLPVTAWTQRYLQLGCGGLCGVMSLRLEHANGCEPAETGQFVTATTNMGHQGQFMGDGSFGSDPQARIDFAYRGVHMTALAAKALIKAFYHQSPKYSYFSGCSDGGREALMEAQRYPDDFDGIAAGAPAMNFQVQNSFYHAWQARANMDAQGRAILTADKLPMLHAAALAECDAKDGLKDGQIDDPRRCNFDPGVLECKAGVVDTSHCLTKAQVATVRKLYAGPHDDQGHRFVVGTVQVGSELNWKDVFVPEQATDPIPSAEMAMGSVRNLVFETNPPASTQVVDFKFDTATFDRLKPLHGLYDATNPDIKAFVNHGGKLILWHGWADPHISPLNTIAYYDAVQKQLGQATTQSVRLFLFPGMGHCFGGDGPSQFDVLTPLMQWVESHQAPEKMVAGRPSTQAMMGPPSAPPIGSHGPKNGMPAGGLAGVRGRQDSDVEPTLPVNRTRPIFPYPLEARYTGQGSIDDAKNFVAEQPKDAEPTIAPWEGSDFYTPGFQKDCAVNNGALVCH